MSPFAVEVAACRAAQQPWAARSVRERLQPVRELRHLLVERADEIFAAIAADIQRPAVEVLATELLPTTAALKYLEQDAARLLAPRRISRRFRPTWLLGSRDAVHRRPWGVVGIIGTWNYPVYLNAVQVVQALTAGNGVLWKPSENVPRTADLTLQLFRDAGFPPGLFVELPATREAGPLLAEADVDHVVFTGSDAVGRKLATKLGERLVPSTLELSGCDAMFVLEDADVVRAAHAAWFGVTLNRGQTCIAVRRIFVHRSKVEAFVEVLKPLIADAKPMTLVTAGQVAQAERVIADAVDRGATLFNPTPQPPPRSGEGESDPAPPSLLGKGAGGLGSDPNPTPQPPPRSGEGEPESTLAPPSLRGKGVGGLGSAPTFLLNASPEMAVCREASFAPIAAVIPFDSIDNALSLAAACPFALAASLFTTNTRAAEALAPRIPAGSVTINDVLAPTAHPATPFGGRGASGWGVTQGAEGLLAMTTPQTVTVRKGKFRPHIDEAVKPDPESTADILGGLLRATHGRGWREWLRGVRQMIRGVRRKR